MVTGAADHFAAAFVDDGKREAVARVQSQSDIVGGVIRFFSEAGRIRFAIRRSRAEAAGISVSSKLLALAVVED